MIKTLIKSGIWYGFISIVYLILVFVFHIDAKINSHFHLPEALNVQQLIFLASFFIVGMVYAAIYTIKIPQSTRLGVSIFHLLLHISIAISSLPKFMSFTDPIAKQYAAMSMMYMWITVAFESILMSVLLGSGNTAYLSVFEPDKINDDN